MPEVLFKQKIRTSGGEATTIYYGERWVGEMFLIYRERDILAGTINIIPKGMESALLGEVCNQVDQYVANLCSALKVAEDQVTIHYGYFQPRPVRDSESIQVVREDEQAIHYELFDSRQEKVRAIMEFNGADLSGSLIFSTLPNGEVIDEVIDRLLKPYDQDLIDTIQFQIEIEDSQDEYIHFDPLEEAREEWVLPDAYNEYSMTESHYLPWRLEVVGEESQSVFYDVIDEEDNTIAEAIFDYDEEGVKISVHFLIPPDTLSKKNMIHQLTREAFLGDNDWINVKMQYQGESIGGCLLGR